MFWRLFLSKPMFPCYPLEPGHLVYDDEAGAETSHHVCVSQELRGGSPTFHAVEDNAALPDLNFLIYLCFGSSAL